MIPSQIERFLAVMYVLMNIIRVTYRGVHLS